MVVAVDPNLLKNTLVVEIHGTRRRCDGRFEPSNLGLEVGDARAQGLPRCVVVLISRKRLDSAAGSGAAGAGTAVGGGVTGCDATGAAGATGFSTQNVQPSGAGGQLGSGVHPSGGAQSPPGTDHPGGALNS
ncbi:MAG TPA: hypothetical protein VK471_11940 [Solirubrobacterales bacterium]|nr:hypothetical protein [Solirubrobacterales bacterium]